MRRREKGKRVKHHDHSLFQPPETEDIQRERHKARELRDSQWWKRQCDKGICHYCGTQTPPQELTMDHVVPLSRGGKTIRGNVVTACKECNNRKKQLIPIEWNEYLEHIKTGDISEEKI